MDLNFRCPITPPQHDWWRLQREYCPDPDKYVLTFVKTTKNNFVYIFPTKCNFYLPIAHNIIYDAKIYILKHLYKLLQIFLLLKMKFLVL